MATDPVRSVQSTSIEATLDIHVADPLRHVAALPPQPEFPYLTVTVDWTPSFSDPGRLPAEELRRSERRNVEEHSTSRRPGRTWLEKELKSVLESIPPRSDQHQALQRSIEQIDAWIDSDLDPSASGLYILAGHDVFIPLALGVSVPNTVRYHQMPALDTLAHVFEDFATYAVLAANQETAELSFITQGTRDQAVTLHSNLYPRRQRQGSLNERRYKRRADERSSAFARAIVSELEAAIQEEPVKVLVLVGSRVFMDEISAEFPDNIKGMIAGVVPLELRPWPTMDQLVEATSEIDLAAEREHEADAVRTVRELMGQNEAVTGAVDVLNALQNHQVELLVMNEDFDAPGWADFTMPLVGIDQVPSEHPTGGDIGNLTQVSLAEEFVRLARLSGGEIEFVHTAPIGDPDKRAERRADELPRNDAARILDEIGGVGATLRFTT